MNNKNLMTDNFSAYLSSINQYQNELLVLVNNLEKNLYSISDDKHYQEYVSTIFQQHKEVSSTLLATMLAKASPSQFNITNLKLITLVENNITNTKDLNLLRTSTGFFDIKLPCKKNQTLQLTFNDDCKIFKLISSFYYFNESNPHKIIKNNHENANSIEIVGAENLDNNLFLIKDNFQVVIFCQEDCEINLLFNLM